MSEWMDEKISAWADEAYNTDDDDDELSKEPSKLKRLEIKKKRFLEKSEKTAITILSAITSMAAMILFSKCM